MNLISKTLFIVILLATCIGGRAAEVVYRLVDYNKSTGEFTLAASGQVPKGAWAYFDSKYGATTGNRYNQILRRPISVSIMRVILILLPVWWQHWACDMITDQLTDENNLEETDDSNSSVDEEENEFN